MSLQIWLPFNGNAENHGLYNVTPTSTAWSSNSLGKIGLCAKLSTSSNFNTLLPISAWDYSEKSISFSLWVKINQAELNAITSTKSYTSTYTTAGGTLIGRHAYKGLALRWKTNNIYSSGSLSSVVVYMAARDNASHSYATTVVNIPWDEWNHVVGIFNRDLSRLELYVNGNLSYTSAINVSYFTSAALQSSNVFLNAAEWDGGNGHGVYAPWYVNDVRVYDHALSEKEVKELAKGLTLHYKLDDGYVEGTTNLVPYPEKTGAASAAWDAALHPDAIKVNGWAVGYNGGVSSPSTGYHAYWKTIDNISTLVFNNLNSDFNMKGRWLGNSTVALYPNIAAGESYTISFDMKTISKRQSAFPYTFGGWYYKITSSASSRSFHDGYYYASNTKLGEWEHFSFTKTRASSFDGNAEYQAFYIYGQSSNEGTMCVRNIQVEKKDHETPYAGSAGTRTPSPVFDSSGFKYNGTPANIVISENAARYSRSFKFNGSSSYIKVESPDWMVSGSTELTINFWAKTSNWTSGRMISCTESGGFNIEPGNSGYLRFPVNAYTNADKTSHAYIYDSSELQISAMPVNQWAMITCVYNAATGTKTYINGVLHHTYSRVTYGLYYYPYTRLFLGCEASSVNPSGPYFNGSISDFRMYYTELSAEDILELYHASASIDKAGNMHTRELIE